MKSILCPSKSRFVALLLGLCVAGTVVVRADNLPTDRPLTLADCVTAALGKNPALEAYKYDLKAADAEIWAQRSALLPQVTGSGQAFYLNGEPVSPFSVVGVTEPELIARHVSSATGWIGSIGLTYPIFENGSFLGLNNAPAVATARAQRKQQEWARNLAEQDAIYTVAVAYFGTVSAQNKTAFYERMVELAKRRVSIVQTKAKLDLALLQDVQIAEARLAANEEGLRAARTKAQEGNAFLARLIGAAGPVQLKLAGPPQAPTVPALDTLLDGIVQKHPQMGIQESVVEKARQDLRLNESHRWPRVRANASYSIGSDLAGGPTPDLVAANIGVDVPLFDFGHYTALAHSSKDKLRAEEQRIEVTRYDIRRSVVEVVGELRQDEEEAASLEELVLKLQFEAKAAKAKQEVGLFTPLSAVDAEVSLLQQQVLLQNARLKQWMKSADLQRTAGGVWKWIP